MGKPLEQFLDRCIDSPAQCDILSTMHAGGNRWWSAKELAAERRLPLVATSQDLETLATRGLLDVRVNTQVEYRIAPISQDLALAMATLAEAYRTNRFEVLNLIRRK